MQILLNVFRNFWNLRRQDKKLVVMVYSALILTRLSLMFLPFRWLRTTLVGVSRSRAAKEIGADSSVWRVLWAVETVSHYAPIKNHCLTKAVVAKIILDRLGYAVDFRIGVNRVECGKIEAHAWLESNGQIIMGYMANIEKYRPFPELAQDEVSTLN